MNNKLLDTTALSEVKSYVDTKVNENSGSTTYTIIDRGTSMSNLKTGFDLNENAETLKAFFKEILAGKYPVIQILTTHSARALSATPGRLFPLDYYRSSSSDDYLTYSFVYTDICSTAQQQDYGVWYRDCVKFDLRIKYVISTETLTLSNYSSDKQYLLQSTDNILGMTNTMSYTPSSNYHPATKKYVDDAVVATKEYINTESVTFKPLPEEVPTTGISTEEFIAAIQALNLPSGMAYLQHVELTDLPAELAGGELEVYIYPSNVVYCVLKSADRAPYTWELNSFENRGWESLSGQAYALPEASENNVGRIVQYVGETTDELTSGYFYQVISETSTETAEDGTESEITTYAWTNINVQDSTESNNSDLETLPVIDATDADYEDQIVALINKHKAEYFPDAERIPTNASKFAFILKGAALGSGPTSFLISLNTQYTSTDRILLCGGSIFRADNGYIGDSFSGFNALALSIVILGSWADGVFTKSTFKLRTNWDVLYGEYNSTEFTPNRDYGIVHKKYVDDAISSAISNIEIPESSADSITTLNAPDFTIAQADLQNFITDKGTDAQTVRLNITSDWIEFNTLANVSKIKSPDATNYTLQISFVMWNTGDPYRHIGEVELTDNTVSADMFLSNYDGNA